MSPSHTNSPNSDENPNPKIEPKTSKIKIDNPNLMHLPEEIWFVILSKLHAIHLIENVQKVCKLFRKICVQPSIFRVINMTLPGYYRNLNYDVNKMIRYAVDRSAGELVDVYVEYCCDDQTLMFIFERSKKLKHLRMGYRPHISVEGLVQAMEVHGTGNCTLEEVEMTLCNTPYDLVESIGRVCCSLKSFTLNDVGTRYRGRDNNYDAMAIAKTMPNLRHLSLIGYDRMSNDGLVAILDACPLLETLDIRACFKIGIWGTLRDRCESLQRFRHPDDSTADCSYRVCNDREPDYDQFDPLEMSCVYVSDCDSPYSDSGYSDSYREYLGSPKFTTPPYRFDDNYYIPVYDSDGNLWDCSGLDVRHTSSESESSNPGSDSDSESN